MAKQMAIVDMGASKIAVVVPNMSNLRSVIGSGLVFVEGGDSFEEPQRQEPQRRELQRRALQKALREAEQQADRRITEVVLLVSEPSMVCSAEQEQRSDWQVIDIACRDRNMRPTLFYNVPSALWRRWLRLCARVNVAHFLLPAAGVGQVLLQSSQSQEFLLIDMGEAATGLALFVEGAPKALGAMQHGGGSITAEIASFLDIPLSIAETIKLRLFLEEKSGGEAAIFPQSALPQMHAKKAEPSPIYDETTLAGLSLSEIGTRIVAPLYYLWFEAIAKIILKFAPSLPSSTPVFITGGAAAMPGVLALASAALKRCVLPVRLPRLTGLEAQWQNRCLGACAGLLAISAHKHILTP